MKNQLLKKLLLIAILVMSTKSFAQDVVYTFTTETDVTTTFKNQNGASMVYNSGDSSLDFTVNGNNQYFIFKNNAGDVNTIDADTYKHVSVTLTNGVDSSILRVLGTTSTARDVSVTPSTAVSKTYIWDLSSDGGWTGAAKTNFAIQFRGGATSGTAKVTEIRFSESAILGTESNELEGVSVYPNPTNGDVTVNSPAGSSIQVYNVLGSVVKSLTGATAVQSVSLEGLSSGVYIVKVANDNKVFQTKIVKS